jgi:hypothetical protein
MLCHVQNPIVNAARPRTLYKLKKTRYDVVVKKTLHIPGELEIDTERGVIYFHCNDAKTVKRFNSQTLLRISHLPVPVPSNQQLDIGIHDNVALDPCAGPVAVLNWAGKEKKHA